MGEGYSAFNKSLRVIETTPRSGPHALSPSQGTAPEEKSGEDDLQGRVEETANAKTNDGAHGRSSPGERD